MFDLLWLCPATFGISSSQKNTWNQLNNWKNNPCYLISNETPFLLADWHREGKSLQSATTANTIFYVYNPALITGKYQNNKYNILKFTVLFLLLFLKYDHNINNA